MALRAVVSISTSAAEDVSVALSYAPVGGAHGVGDSVLPALWREAKLGADNEYNVEVELLRLRPGAKYRVKVYVVSGSSDTCAHAATTHFRAPKTGIPRFDDNALATISGDSLPSWQMLTFAYDVHVTPQQFFSGLVAVDQEGWVVWYYPMQIAAWDFMPRTAGGGVVLLSAIDANRQEFGSRYEQEPKMWTGPLGDVVVGNSQLQEIEPCGSLRKQYVQGCSGSPSQYNALSHEARIDHTSPDLDVLTVAFDMRIFPNTTIRTKIGTSSVTMHTHTDTFYGSRIVRWHRNEAASLIGCGKPP